MKKYIPYGMLILALIFMTALLYLWTPSVPEYDANSLRKRVQDYNVRIIRDQWGVAHIFGKTDADSSFGLAYAHAEDDWKTIQEVVIASRGMSGQYFGKDKAPTDYLFDLFKVKDFVEEKYETEVPDYVKAIARAYADGLSLYAAEHPDVVLPGVLPMREQDVIQGISWATPFFYRLDGQLEDLFKADDKPAVSPWQQTSEVDHKVLGLPEAVRGSNAFAIAPARSEDHHTRLIVNSHQPMKGPYAWYEAHVVSEDGLNFAGAGFPGTPILTQGVTPHHGWAHTVNQPDLTDVYLLEVDNEKRPRQYKLDGKWKAFERSHSKFRVKLLGPLSLPVKRDVLWSDHGPVLSTPSGHYAIRFAGLGEVGALEQWIDMSKAQNLDEWRAAMAKNGVLSFNITYADKHGNIGEHYNAKMPNRIEGPDWDTILPGDQSRLIWTDYRDPSDLPVIWNPHCGWLFSANSTPFRITDNMCNNERSDYSSTFGIETRMTNRALRSLALFSPDDSLSEEELLRYRADTRYDPQSQIMQMVVELVSLNFDEPLLKQAQDVLRDWDGDTHQNNRGAALAIITGTRALGYEYIEAERDPVDTLRETAHDLMERFGRLDPEWGAINRLQRGDIDMPLDGAPDVLRAIYADRDGIAKDGVMNAFAGDTHIMYADWDEKGVLKLQTIHQYGAATLDENSPHYNDQAPLFARGEYKDFPMTLDAVLPHATRDYHPGRDF